MACGMQMTIVIMIFRWFMVLIEGSLEAKVPTIWTDEKHSQKETEIGRSSDVEKVRREKIRDGESQKREKVGKSKNTVFFRCFVARRVQKVGSLKRRVRRHLARWEMKNCTPLWREAHLEVKSVKTRRSRTTVGSWDVEKVHVEKVHAFRTTSGSSDVEKVHGSENVQNTTCSEKCEKHHMGLFWCVSWQIYRWI